MNTEIVVALIGLVSFFLGYLFNKRKNDAEIEKLKAETDLLRSQLKPQARETNNHDSTSANEIILYDGRHGFRSYDIVSHSDYNIQQGVLVIPHGEPLFELRTYICEGKEAAFIPKNGLLSGYRNFRVSCEVKVISASYELSVFVREEPSLGIPEYSAEDRYITITNTTWTPIEYHLRVLPNINCVVYVTGSRLSGIGSLQMRNLMVAERVS